MLKVRIDMALVKIIARDFNLFSTIHIDGHELVGNEMIDGQVYLLFQEIDVPTNVEWATDYRNRVNND